MFEHPISSKDDRTGNIARVSLVLTGDKLVPAVVTERLGLTGTQSFAKGEPIPGDQAQAKGGWRLTMEAPSVAEAANLLLKKLEGREEDLLALAAELDAKVEVRIWWEPEGGYGGFEVGSEAVRRLTLLSHEVRFCFV